MTYRLLLAGHDVVGVVGTQHEDCRAFERHLLPWRGISASWSPLWSVWLEFCKGTSATHRRSAFHLPERGNCRRRVIRPPLGRTPLPPRHGQGTLPLPSAGPAEKFSGGAPAPQLRSPRVPGLHP